MKQAIFFLLDVFMHIKMLSFLFHTKRSTKSIKSTKSINIAKTQISEQATFLTLEVFYAHKKAQKARKLQKAKKHKKHKKCKKNKKRKKRKKAQNAKQAAFLLLDTFYAHKNSFFFVFICLYAFYTFCACEIFL